MNSIATMKHEKESIALAAAIERSGLSKVAIGKALGGITGPAVSQWIAGARPVPAHHAIKLGHMLGVAPESISAAYAKVSGRSTDGSSALAPHPESDDELRPDLRIARLENDVHALNVAIAALAVAMVQHRPAEARDAAGSIRRTVHRSYIERGLIHELLQTLDRA